MYVLILHAYKYIKIFTFTFNFTVTILYFMRFISFALREAKQKMEFEMKIMMT